MRFKLKVANTANCHYKLLLFVWAPEPGCTLIRLQALGTGRYPLPSLALGSGLVMQQARNFRRGKVILNICHRMKSLFCRQLRAPGLLYFYMAIQLSLLALR